MKKFLSIFLSILLLASSAGVTMATHYCGGQAMESQLMLGLAGLDCGMNDMDKNTACESQNDSSEPHLKMENCCENHYVSIESEDTVITKLSIHAPDLNFFLALAFTYLGLHPAEVDHTTRYLNYSPPLLKQDIPVLHQSFLL